MIGPTISISYKPALARFPDSLVHFDFAMDLFLVKNRGVDARALPARLRGILVEDWTVESEFAIESVFL